VGVQIGGGSYNLVFTGGSVHNNGISLLYDGDGIGIGEAGAASHDILIEGMALYENGNQVNMGNNVAIGVTSTSQTPYNVTIQYNQLNTADWSGINVSCGTSIIAAYNTITSNGEFGISATAATGISVSLAAYNNTIVGNALDGLVAWSTGGTITVTAKNNIFYNNNTGGSGYYSEISWQPFYQVPWNTNTTIASDYNDIYHSLSGAILIYDTSMSFGTWKTNSGQDTHSISVNPLFNNPSAGDFTLQSGSPAIGAGIYIPGVSTVNPPNIGAK
jgi:hypothetical protein